MDPTDRESPPHLVVTDLDGTLLDDHYEFAAAGPALAALRRTGAPLVLASSKTRAEMEPLAQRLGFPASLIVETGGAVGLPRPGGAFEWRVLGATTVSLAAALCELGRELGVAVQGFSSWSAAELAHRCGLDPDSARRALAREHSEPFLLGDEGAAPALAAAAVRRGLRVTRGGTFFHLTGEADKGAALAVVLADFARQGRRFRTIGLGDADNDLSFLRVVDRPIVIPGSGGVFAAALAAALPTAEVAPSPGPRGWNAAVLTVLAGGHLPHLGAALRESSQKGEA